MFVPVSEPAADVAFEGLDRAVDATFELLLCELGEPPRSTRFSQDELVGVKCRRKRGCASSHFLMAGVLWVT
jgi:hypothetical protein